MLEVEHDDGDKVLVTFRMPPEVAAEEVCVAGEFNDWSQTAHPMSRERDEFAITIPLEAGRTYRFRYVLDGERWENDWAADAYVPNEFGGEDSVVDLTIERESPAPVEAKPADPKPAKTSASKAKKAPVKRRDTKVPQTPQQS
jgi:1,4-alpha-glucan branching enzyme